MTSPIPHYHHHRLTVLEQFNGSYWNFHQNLSHPLNQSEGFHVPHLVSGQSYKLQFSVFNEFRVPNASLSPFEMEIQTLRNGSSENVVMIVVDKESDKQDFGTIAINDPIRLLPIVGKIDFYENLNVFEH